jgi:hypothetical protein
MKKLQLELRYGHDVERHVFDFGDFERTAAELSCYSEVPPLFELITAVKETMEHLILKDEAALLRKLVAPIIERALNALQSHPSLDRSLRSGSDHIQDGRDDIRACGGDHNYRGVQCAEVGFEAPRGLGREPLV